MKALKTILLVFIVVAAQQVSKAAVDGNDEKAVKNVINTYLDAFCHGKLKGFSQLLDENVKFTTERGDKIITYTKSEMLDALRKSANVEQNCKTDYSIIENLPNQMVVKVNMKYESFTKENFVTLTESENGWKITHVSTAFK
ncbi:nuclear transport factor 2 family protein [Rubrolithibacter danxiaensis]|uniref:nuclear transport factor 2 family protein n=1 Tax=Rubrolithibacter danxiaensis TaxID=3390805 RepID=UPI003BF91E40